MSNIKLFLLILLQINILITSNSQTEEINLKSTEQIDLYTLNSFYRGYLEIPKDDDHLLKYQIEEGKQGKYTVYGYSVKVNEYGTVTPKNVTIYYYINGSITEKFIPGLEVNKTDITFSTGTSIVSCEAGDTSFNITFEVHDYAKDYTEETLQKYVEENVKNKTTQYEQYIAITDYISQFPYSPDVESYITLIILKKGNSWATSSAIDYMAKYAGIKSHIRVSENDNDNETILRSVVALIDDHFYVAKILYNKTLDKNYTINEIPQGYSYRKSEDEENIIIYQYDGYEEEITIPNKLDGHTVIGLDKKCFANGVKFSDTKITKITIPESIKSIGDGTFSDLYNLKEITIPKSVEKIGYNVFEGCHYLEKINVDSKNLQYCSDEGILYNKDKTILVSYPPGIEKDEFNSSKILQKFDNSSFYKNKHLNKVYLSKSINYIGGQAFGDSEIEEIYFKGDPPYIADDAFLYLFITVYYPKNNTKWNSTIESGDYGAFEISWKEIEVEDEEEDEEKKQNGQPEEESNTIIWVLIVVGIVIILIAIIFLIIIKRKDSTSENIESIGNDGLLKEKNENE